MRKLLATKLKQTTKTDRTMSYSYKKRNGLKLFPTTFFDFLWGLDLSPLFSDIINDVPTKHFSQLLLQLLPFNYELPASLCSLLHPLAIPKLFIVNCQLSIASKASLSLRKKNSFKTIAYIICSLKFGI